MAETSASPTFARQQLLFQQPALALPEGAARLSLAPCDQEKVLILYFPACLPRAPPSEGATLWAVFSGFGQGVCTAGKLKRIPACCQEATYPRAWEGLEGARGCPQEARCEFSLCHFKSSVKGKQVPTAPTARWTDGAGPGPAAPSPDTLPHPPAMAGPGAGTRCALW